MSSYKIRVGYTATLFILSIAILGFFVIYLSYLYNDFLLFFLGFFLVILAIASIFSLAVVEVTLSKKKYFDLSRLKGMTGEAKTRIEKNGRGVVYIEGEEWTAIALEEINEGDLVIIEDVKSNILFVRRK